MSYPLVVVEWVDAWYDPDETARSDFKPAYPVSTVGYLVRDEEDVVSVAQETLEDDDMFRAVTHIPRALVDDIVSLRRDEQPDPEDEEPPPSPGWRA